MNEAQKAVLEIVESVDTDGVDEARITTIASNSSRSASVKGFLSINPCKIVKIFIAVIRISKKLSQ
ncbi:hypothetical protein [Microcystis sp. LSC13-02]|uniref:hypothetical protein n=1 Tax=Microcystis sp. LSC13-02 TaxID=1895004 RepID=UPI00257EB30F|nr:hypothetical protein [Microcystis sp. LSC13-02]